MKRPKFTIWTISIIALLPTTSFGLLIQADYGNITDPNEKAVIDEAVMEWRSLLPCKDGLKTLIHFTCDNNLQNGTLGFTDPNYVTDSKGVPLESWITIDNDAHNWTTGPADTNPNVWDAAQTLKHEIAHAIGFTVNLDRFKKNIVTLGANRFYDLNHNGIFDSSDYDLIDLTSGKEGTHSYDGSYDLMERFLPGGERRTPTLKMARVLSDAYGYCLVPELPTPFDNSAMLLGLTAGLLLALRNRNYETM